MAQTALICMHTAPQPLLMTDCCETVSAWRFFFIYTHPVICMHSICRSHSFGWHLHMMVCCAFTVVNNKQAVVSQVSCCSSLQSLSVSPSFSSSSQLNLKSALHNLIWNYNINHTLIPHGYQFQASLQMLQLQIQADMHNGLMIFNVQIFCAGKKMKSMYQGQ